MLLECVVGGVIVVVIVVVVVVGVVQPVVVVGGGGIDSLRPVIAQVADRAGAVRTEATDVRAPLVTGGGWIQAGAVLDLKVPVRGERGNSINRSI